MRISFVSLFYPQEPIRSSAYLRRFPLYRHLPERMASRGHDVEFVQLHPREPVDNTGNVIHRFRKPGPAARAMSAAAAAVTGKPRSLFEAAPDAVGAVMRHRPDVVHFHGTQLHLNLALLRRRLGGGALVLHYHGGFPPRLRPVRALQRKNFEAADAILFTMRDQAAPFLDTGILRDPSKIFELVETSSSFAPSPNKRRLRGDPVFLSTCRLHPIKDPWTTLRGFELVLDTFPDASLYHYYLSDEMLPELRSYVEERPRLRGSVHFRGARPYDEMEAVYNAGDVLLQSSRREFSGCAVLDAMACGVVPVVSDIPPFRKMTADGRFGRLFEAGSPTALADAVSGLDGIEGMKSEVRAHFERELSFDAMADRLEKIYEDVLERRHE